MNKLLTKIILLRFSVAANTDIYYEKIDSAKIDVLIMFMKFEIESFVSQFIAEVSSRRLW